jgi:hypothetical protein
VAAGEQRNGSTLIMAYHCLLRAVEIGRKIKETDEIVERIAALEAQDGERGSETGRAAWRR